MLKKYKRITNIVVFILMCFFLFSLFFLVSESQHECEHVVCSQCVEIEKKKDVLESEISMHGDCKLSCCETCDDITKQQQILKTMSSSHHECVKGDCSICYQIEAYKEKIKSILFFVTAFSAVVAALYVIRLITIHKAEYYTPSTLISLKVKLTA